jgi:hypothetical protein
MVLINCTGHSGFTVESDSHFLIFDYSEGALPQLPQKKKVYVFISHSHEDHFNPEVFSFCREHPNVRYVVSYDIPKSILSDCGIRADAVVVDPPHKGLTPEVISYLAELNPSRVVYISCDADTLARDIVRFREVGYDTDTVQPVDMFSRTGHVECVTRLRRVTQ